ncbi:MAG TPA: hypothetical protein DDZ51_16750 [Planctomycetaceae bacterium]|nr:hypothetical protein [Planctomycetaceae bacterium]
METSEIAAVKMLDRNTTKAFWNVRCENFKPLGNRQVCRLISSNSKQWKFDFRCLVTFLSVAFTLSKRSAMLDLSIARPLFV